MICLQNQILASWISLQSSTGPIALEPSTGRTRQQAEFLADLLPKRPPVSGSLGVWLVMVGGVDDGFGLEVGRLSWGGVGLMLLY